MKKLIVLAVAALVATPAFAGEMKWSGSTGWRYTSATNNDGLNQTDGNGDLSQRNFRDHSFRAELGASGGWKNVEWGTAVATTGAGPNSDYVNSTSGASASNDFAISLQQGWFRYMMGSNFGDWGFTFGRQMNAFAYDTTTQNFFDNDVRFDGLGMSWKWGSFGVNAAHYVLGAINTSGTVTGSTATTTASTEKVGVGGHMMSLQGIQPHFSWKFRDDIDTMFAVGYYSWNKTASTYTNAVHGLNTAAGAAVVGTADNGSVTMNPHQWQLYNTWSLPYKLGFSWEYVMNKSKPKFGTSANEAGGNALSLALSYGMIKRAHDFKVGYAYGSKDLGSVINAFSNNRWLADNKGHMVSATYALADNFNLGWKGYFLKEKSKMNATTGVALTTTQEQKLNLWELTAGVSF